MSGWYYPKLRSLLRLIVSVAVGVTVFHGPALSAQKVPLAMLDRLQAGQWEVRDRDPAGARDRICISNGRSLVQIRHMTDTCRRFVVEDGADAVTVHYTCPGNGYGQTRIRFENEQLVQLETQGIAKGLPFQINAEVRRTGGCAR